MKKLYLLSKIRRFRDRIWFAFMIWVVKTWVNGNMDQWEKWKWQTDYGTIYLSITRHDDYPDSFDNV